MVTGWWLLIAQANGWRVGHCREGRPLLDFVGLGALGWRGTRHVILVLLAVFNVLRDALLLSDLLRAALLLGWCLRPLGLLSAA